jgi:hypothetical protein
MKFGEEKEISSITDEVLTYCVETERVDHAKRYLGLGLMGRR